MRNWTVAINDPNGAGLIFPEQVLDLADVDMWELRVQQEGDEGQADEWGMATVDDGLTVEAAYELARSMGLEGVPVGGTVPL